MDPQLLAEIAGTCMHNDKIYHTLTVWVSLKKNQIYINIYIFIHH